MSLMTEPVIYDPDWAPGRSNGFANQNLWTLKASGLTVRLERDPLSNVWVVSCNPLVSNQIVGKMKAYEAKRVSLRLVGKALADASTLFAQLS